MRFYLYILPFLLLTGICFCLSGQGRFTPCVYIEAGTGINLSYFDVGGGSPGVSIQGGVLYDLDPNWRLGANIGVHRTMGTDTGTSEAARGYAFRGNLNEITAKGVYLFRFKPYPAKKWKTKLEPRAWAIAEDLSLLIEAGGNMSTSDYLEGFADPENSLFTDIFFTMLMKFIYKVPRVWN
ncbi:MAG: hypothetical protein KAR19_11830 [Bacteroidales bacterium]|nr:hypothetical protein [Bacteroidales bacterium]